MLDVRAIGFQNWPSPHLLPRSAAAAAAAAPLISNESFVLRSLVPSFRGISIAFGASGEGRTDADDGQERAAAAVAAAAVEG